MQEPNTPEYQNAKAAAMKVPVAIPAMNILEGAMQLAKNLAGVAAILPADHPLRAKFEQADALLGEWVREDLTPCMEELMADPTKTFGEF